jgi:hypothetical protein
MAAMAACRTCGTEPLANARFCHGCGSPVDESDTRAEYKQATVLFADVVGSMKLAAVLQTERLREIMNELFNRAAAVVQRYQGTVDKFTGDGLMALLARRWRWRIMRRGHASRRWRSSWSPRGSPTRCFAVTAFACSFASGSIQVR